MNRWHYTGTIAAVLMIGFIAGALMTNPMESVSHADSHLKKEASGRVFELRTYTTAPGKLDDLHARFRNHTNPLFVKHGMSLIAYFTPTDGAEAKNTLVYLLAYPSREAREKSWKGFMNDPAWKKAFKESRADGPIVTKVVNKFLTPTDYSPIR